MDAVDKIALTMGVGWASGINLYAAVFMLGFMGGSGDMTLPVDLQFLADPMVMMVAALMYCVEFFADKTPGVDTGWDVLHTFIRIPAGAILAMKSVGDVNQAAELTAFLVGGTLAGVSHFTKAGSRAVINTSPEPFSNWAASLTEDVAVIGGLWAALHYPLAFLVMLAVFIMVAIWLLPRLWRAIRSIARRVGRFFNAGGGTTAAALTPADQHGGPTPLPPT